MEDDLKLRLALNKVPVVYLNSVTDFPTWHLALRRLVKGYNMGDALLFSIPRSQVRIYEQRQGMNMSKPTGDKPKQEGKPDNTAPPKKSSTKKGDKKSKVEGKDSPEFMPQKKEEAAGAGAQAVPEIALDDDLPPEMKAMLDSFGVTESLNEFFSATTTFVNCRTRAEESTRDNYFRQDIWTWIETSLSRASTSGSRAKSHLCMTSEHCTTK